MSTITFENNNMSSFMLVPSFIVDKFLKSASHSDIKVLLYFIRNTGMPLDEAEAYRAMDIDAEQLKNSLAFWVRVGVWQKRGGRLSFALQTGGFNTDEMPAYSGETVALRAENDEGLKFLLNEAQKRLSKMLSPSDISVLFGMYDWLGLPADVILMLIEYCVTSGNNGMRYIEKCAMNWADDGVITYEKAEEKIRQLQMRNSIEGKVAALMGISNQARSKKQKDFIAKWSIEWDFSLDMIGAAYESMVDRIGKLSFDYMDKILTSWHEKGFKNIEDTKAEETPKKGKKNSNTTSYDLDDLFRPSWEILDK